MSDYEHPTPVTDPDGNTGQDRRPGLVSSSSAPGANRVSQVWADKAAESAQSDDSADDPVATPAVELTAIEARVVGSLIEKSFLTPDVNPMTTNALATACNQKTNRDPVVDYSAVQIDATLLELRQRNLVRRVHTPGSRATKHRQTLDEALSLDEQESALLSVLLLRGPQTVGELRLRTERHDVGFDDLDAVDACLERLAARPTALVRQLPRKPGHKESRWQHLLQGAAETAAAAQDPGRQPAAASGAAGSTDASTPTATPAMVHESAGVIDADLAERVAELESDVAGLRRQLRALAESLGETLE